MEKIIFILLFISFGFLHAQVKNDRINFALLNYDLTDKKLDFNEQEKFLGATYSIGDKTIILEEIFKKLLICKNFSYEDSIMQSFFDGFTETDRLAVLKLPKVVEDWREIPFHLVRMSHICKAYTDKTTLSEAFLNIQKDQPSKFPHMPEEGNDEYEYKVLNMIKYYSDYVNWYVSYPDEFEYFINLFRSGAKKFSGKKSKGAVLKFINHAKREALANDNTTDKQNIPIGLKEVVDYHANQKSKNIKYVDICNKKDINEFITKAYDLVYREKIPDNVLHDLSTYVKEKNVYDPELIYLAIILSRYE